MDIFLICFTSLLISFTLLPLVRNDYWTFRIFDYPRIQKLILTVICLFLLAWYPERDYIFMMLTALMSLNAVYLIWLILPFTFFGKKHTLKISTHKPEQALTLMVANVYQDNTNSKGCLREIAACDPDIVLLLETNARWEKETSDLDKAYPYSIKAPMENTYGMLLYSKLELREQRVKYMVEDDVPSIHTQVILPAGVAVQLYGVHPTPPVPNENPRSTERDKELLLIADLVKKKNMPTIVMGDLNDVAWSHTTELFLKMSGLLDPRRGRGFFNTFNAKQPLLRFPLDHAFISDNFKLKEMKRLGNFGSDHFPIFLDVQYEASASAEQHSMKPDADDREEAKAKKAKV